VPPELGPETITPGVVPTGGGDPGKLIVIGGSWNDGS
jgi:hypothetical protein